MIMKERKKETHKSFTVNTCSLGSVLSETDLPVPFKCCLAGI